jgi:hypothetical protein
VADQHELNLLTNAGGRELQLLEVDDNPEGAKVREVAAQRLRGSTGSTRLTADSIAEKLKQPDAQVAATPKLPWLPEKDGDTGTGGRDDRPAV